MRPTNMPKAFNHTTQGFSSFTHQYMYAFALLLIYLKERTGVIYGIGRCMHHRTLPPLRRRDQGNEALLAMPRRLSCPYGCPGLCGPDRPGEIYRSFRSHYVGEPDCFGLLHDLPPSLRAVVQTLRHR